MHYYQFNIADYRKDTNHLSLLEHGIYRSLLDTYYLNETPLCKDDATLMRTHCIRTEEEKAAFKNILSDYFILTKKGYTHKKCAEQISKYNAKSDKARVSAKVRWDAEAMRTHSEGNANHKPLTINHKPLTNNHLKDNKDLFDLFWINSSKRGDKKKAYSYFNKILNKKDSPKEFTDFLINDIKQRKESGQLGFDQMHITTYLNGERFDDEIQSGESNEPNRFTKPSKETALERMARKQKAMDAGAEASGHYETVLGQNDSVISTQVYDH